ncbi:hypothetical protein [Halobacteriovorax sp. HLS]|uniref:hypothetical protein n=1 Tax=Halobacteriovorax sp. HLS TaxID=2234000 RepID=UPI000FD915A2|nr:hypothetical protein [Halobacteriovorax sp. HLS]
MFKNSLQFGSRNLVKFVLDNYIYFILFLAFSITVDFLRTSFSQGNVTFEQILAVVELLFTYFITAALIRKGLQIISQDETSIYSNFWGRFFIYLRVNIVYTLFFLGGVFLLVLPGLFALVFLFYAPLLVLDPSYKDDSYFKKSIELAKKNKGLTAFIAVFSLIVMGLDFALLPQIKDSQFPLLWISLKSIIMTAIDFFMVLFNVQVYWQLKK